MTPLPQVVCGDGIEFKAGDESAKIPARHYLPYATSKTEAEAAVLAASSPTLQTVAIRSGYIFGKNCIGVALELKTSLQRHGHYVTAMVPAKISCVNPSNCARAHILAWERRAHVCGKAYFIRDFDANVVDLNIRYQHTDPMAKLHLYEFAWAIYAFGSSASILILSWSGVVSGVSKVQASK